MKKSLDELLQTNVPDLSFKDIKDFGKYHLAISTALITASTPIFAGLELGVTELSNSIVEIGEYVQMNENLSKSARIIAGEITFLGMGLLATSYLKKSRIFFNIQDSSPETSKSIHDSFSIALFNLLIAPLFYFAGGATTSQEIATGTGIAVGFSFLSGALIGGAIDTYETLLEMNDSVRVPQKIKNLGKKTKMGIAAGITALSIGSTVGMYELYDIFNK